jgi:phospholipid/cholesterol/gamma-HCH transport system substrate-binding protein
MKVSNETKVGALTVIAVTLLVLGYNFLKGKSLVRKSNVIYARFPDAGALEVSNPVKIKGYKIGNVYKIDRVDADVSEIVVAINLQEPVNIPENSIAIVNSGLTGITILNIIPGNSRKFVTKGDTLNSGNNPDLLAKIMTSIDPVTANLKQAVDSLRAVLGNINSMFDDDTKSNLKSTIANLKTSTNNLSVLLNSKDGALAKTLNNAQAFTANLNGNNEKLNTTMENLRLTTEKFKNLQLQETITNLNNSVTQLQGILQKANSKDGTLGLLINDPKLYNNLQNATRSINILVDDLKVHPKRYLSIFGKRDKSDPLKAPLADSSFIFRQ